MATSWTRFTGLGRLSDLSDGTRKLVTGVFRQIDPGTNMDDERLVEAMLELIRAGFLDVRIKAAKKGVMIRWRLQHPDGRITRGSLH